MKQITIIGATAGVGLLAVKQALNRGLKVVSLSRSTNNLPDHRNLIKLVGSATNSEDIKKSIADSDAVIIAIGTGSSMKATTLYTDFANALIKTQKETQTQIPFIILTGFGAGDSSKYQGIISKIVFALLLKKIYLNKTKMEEMIAKSSIKWEFVRPGMLNDKPLTQKYHVITEYFDGMKVGNISRADVADFLIRQAVNPTELGKYPALTN